MLFKNSSNIHETFMMKELKNAPFSKYLCILKYFLKFPFIFITSKIH